MREAAELEMSSAEEDCQPLTTIQNRCEEEEGENESSMEVCFFLVKYHSYQVF
jgi:hypothetical protein